MAAMVSSSMGAESAGGQFLEEQARLLIAFPVEVMDEHRVGGRGQLPRQAVQARKNGEQIGLGFGGGHSLHRALHFQQRIQDPLFDFGHA